MLSAGIVYLYTIVDDGGNERGLFDTYQEAYEAIGTYPNEAVLEYVFEFAESSWAYIPGGGDDWPMPGE